MASSHMKLKLVAALMTAAAVASACSGCNTATPSVGSPFVCQSATSTGGVQPVHIASHARVVRVESANNSQLRVEGQYAGSKPRIERAIEEIGGDEQLYFIPGEPGDGAGGSETVCTLGRGVVWQPDIMAKNSQRVHLDFSEVGVHSVSVSVTGDCDITFADATFDLGSKPRSGIRISPDGMTPQSTLTLRVPGPMQVVVYSTRRPSAAAEPTEPYGDTPGWSFGGSSRHRLVVWAPSDRPEPRMRVIRSSGASAE